MPTYTGMYSQNQAGIDTYIMVVGGGALTLLDGFLYNASAVSLRVITVIRKKTIIVLCLMKYS